MKFRLQYILAATLAGIYLPPARSAELTLSQAVDYAIKNNYRIASLRSRLHARQSDRQSVSTNFLPRAGIVTGAQSYAKATTSTLNYGYIKYNLFNGFRDQIALDQAKIDENQARLSLEEAKFELTNELEKHFHTYVYLRELITLKNRALDLNDQHRNLVRKTKRSGLSSKADVMEFQLRTSILLSDRTMLEQKISETQIHLKKILGENIGRSIIPTGKLQHQHITADLMDYLNKVRKNNFKLKHEVEELNRTKLESKRSNATWLPKIDLAVNAGYLPQESHQIQSAFDVNVLFTVDFEIFSGLRSKFQSTSAQQNIDSRKYAVKDGILESITQIEISYRRLKTIEARVDLEQDNIDMSRSYYNEVRSEYRRGYKDAPDLASAADTFIRSKERRVQFMHTFLLEKLALERELGTRINVEVIHEKAKT